MLITWLLFGLLIPKSIGSRVEQLWLSRSSEGICDINSPIWLHLRGGMSFNPASRTLTKAVSFNYDLRKESSELAIPIKRIPKATVHSIVAYFKSLMESSLVFIVISLGLNINVLFGPAASSTQNKFISWLQQGSRSGIEWANIGAVYAVRCQDSSNFLSLLD